MDRQARIISENLTRLIESRGVSQKDVADALGFSPQTLNTWIKGGAVPRMGKIQKLADYFGVKKTDIIEEHKPAEAYEALTASDIIKKAFNDTGYYDCEFTDDEIIEIMQYASFILLKRATK